MPRPRALRALPVLLLMLAASAASLALPACSRKHRIIGPLNERPTVSLTASATSGPTPLLVTFTAVGDDPDGTIASWSWAFSDSGTHMHGSVSTVDHTFVTAGTYTVTVRATDNYGAYAEATDTVRVGGADQAPVVNAGPDQSNLDPGVTVTLSGAITEPDAQGYSYSW